MQFIKVTDDDGDLHLVNVAHLISVGREDGDEYTTLNLTHDEYLEVNETLDEVFDLIYGKQG